MIALEYIIGQYQHRGSSIAFKSRKPSQENPAIVISVQGNEYVWQLRGLRTAKKELVSGKPRATHLDFYIGMDDLNEQRNQFPTTRARSMGIVDGLRIPVGTERTGGTKIRWRGPLGRVKILCVEMTIPPFRLRFNDKKEVVLNIDKETSRYPIVSESGSHTTHELHFGIEHDYIIQKMGTVKLPRAEFRMTAKQYATVLEAMDKSLSSHLGH
jgi:hypothetical protein